MCSLREGAEEQRTLPPAAGAQVRVFFGVDPLRHGQWCERVREIGGSHGDGGGGIRQGFGRGLCVFNDGKLVAGGSSPSTVSVYALEDGELVKQINLTMMH